MDSLVSAEFVRDKSEHKHTDTNTLIYNMPLLQDILRFCTGRRDMVKWSTPYFDQYFYFISITLVPNLDYVRVTLLCTPSIYYCKAPFVAYNDAFHCTWNLEKIVLRHRECNGYWQDIQHIHR